MRKDWKSPWFWICLALMVVWAFFLVEGSGLAVRPIVTNVWYILLALLILVLVRFISKRKLNPPFPIGCEAAVTIGGYLICTILPRFAVKG